MLCLWAVGLPSAPCAKLSHDPFMSVLPLLSTIYLCVYACGWGAAVGIFGWVIRWSGDGGSFGRSRGHECYRYCRRGGRAVPAVTRVKMTSARLPASCVAIAVGACSSLRCVRGQAVCDEGRVCRVPGCCLGLLEGGMMR